MRSITRVGFQPMNPFMGGSMVMGAGRIRLGVVIDKATHDQLLAKIQAGSTRLAGVRAWIDTKLDTDPTLETTFLEAFRAQNFWNYMDIARSNQWYVDQAKEALAAASGWNLDEETIGKTNDWIDAINIAYDAAKQYGKVDPITLLPGGGAPTPTPTGTPGIQTPPPSGGPSTATILTVGAVAVAVVGLAALLWPKS